MSRGPGKWERLLVAALYHATERIEYLSPYDREQRFGTFYPDPQVWTQRTLWTPECCRWTASGTRVVVPSDYVDTPAGYSAIQRAARRIVTRGWASTDGGYANWLTATSPDCPLCPNVHQRRNSGVSEHIPTQGDS